MAKYLVTFESCEGDDSNDCTVVVQSRSAIDVVVSQWKEDGYMDDGEMPVVYELGKKMKASIETKVKLTGE